MATIKSFTSLEQSKRLAEILPLESADMVYLGIHQGMDGKYYLSGTNTEDDVVPIYKNFFIKVFAKTTASDVINNQLPCWSLAALLDILPTLDDRNANFCKDIRYDKWHVYYHSTATSSIIDTERYDNLLDACVAMIIRLHELKML